MRIESLDFELGRKTMQISDSELCASRVLISNRKKSKQKIKNRIRNSTMTHGSTMPPIPNFEF